MHESNHVADTGNDTQPESQSLAGIYWGQAQSLIVQGVAHEINNLMASVLGNASLLKEEAQEGRPGWDRLDSIESAAIKAGALGRRLLMLTQGAQGRAERVQINSLATRVLAGEERTLAPRISISRYVNPDAGEIEGNAAQLAQLVLNLAINAVESIPAEGRVTIRTRRLVLDEDAAHETGDLDPGTYVCFTVEDSGTGIPRKYIDRIFEAGFTTKRGRQGMGLVAAHEIVTSHRGRIFVSSEEGSGTEVRVYLPALSEQSREPVADQMALLRGNETILIVDDDTAVMDAIRNTLTRLGYRTLVARNGREALDVVEQSNETIDVTLLDMIMPVMGGAETLPLLRKARPDMRVIVSTGLEHELSSQDLLRSNVDAFLLKPFQSSLLAREIRRVLDQDRRSTDEF